MHYLYGYHAKNVQNKGLSAGVSIAEQLRMLRDLNELYRLSPLGTENEKHPPKRAA
jgi:hypothetical protein